MMIVKLPIYTSAELSSTLGLTEELSSGGIAPSLQKMKSTILKTDLRNTQERSDDYETQN